MFVWFQINCCMVNTIWFRFDLIRFRKNFSLCNRGQFSPKHDIFKLGNCNPFSEVTHFLVYFDKSSCASLVSILSEVFNTFNLNTFSSFTGIVMSGWKVSLFGNKFLSLVIPSDVAKFFDCLEDWRIPETDHWKMWRSFVLVWDAVQMN